MNRVETRGGRRSRSAPKTIFEIKREARWRKWLMFGLLVALVFGFIFVPILIAYLTIAVRGDLGLSFAWAPLASLAWKVLVFSLVVSTLYWFLSQVGAKERLRRTMTARPLDPQDRFHQRLANVVDEMRLATGDRRIECVVVPTVGMNAFAFSDLHSTFVVGVTEGALSRLSRPQLQAVVAHEFAHVLSGDCDTATMSCLLFGVYSALSDTLYQSMNAGVSYAVVPYAGLGVVRVAAAVTNAAISRTGELAADRAAAAFTGDPLSLAQALHMMRRHPGGAGHIPSGMSPLCIRPTDLGPGATTAGILATHPLIEKRIVELLKLANVGYDDFVKGAAQAQEYLDGREHFEMAPGPRADRLDATATAATTAAPLAPVVEPLGAVSEALAPIVDPLTTAATPPAAAGAPATVPGPLAGASVWVPRTARRERERPPEMACPSCEAHLRAIEYEGVPLHSCPACAGRLVAGEAVQRIVTRRQVGFSAEQEHLADIIYQQGDTLRRRVVLRRGTTPTEMVGCPKCGKTMMRGHYTYQYAVEVDRCVACDLIWFETDELEVLQILVERLTG